MIYFKDVPKVGDLYWDKELFKYDQNDVLFVCRDDNDALYYCLCKDDLFGHYSWLVAPVTEAQINQVLHRGISALTPFKDVEEVLVIDYTKSDHFDCQYKWCKYTEIDPADLPATDLYFPRNRARANSRNQYEIDKNKYIWAERKDEG